MFTMSDTQPILKISTWEMTEMPVLKSARPGTKNIILVAGTPVNTKGVLGPGTLENTKDILSTRNLVAILARNVGNIRAN